MKRKHKKWEEMFANHFSNKLINNIYKEINNNKK